MAFWRVFPKVAGRLLFKRVLDHLLEAIGVGIHGTLGTGHLNEYRSFLSLDDGSDQGISGLRGLGTEGSTAKKGSVSLRAR